MENKGSPDIPTYLTTDETAAICRVSAATVRWWRHVGRGPRCIVVPGGRRVLYRRSDVLEWIESGLEPEAALAVAQ